MSGDVQPRKRKDKKKKKDDLGLVEPRGTAAALGDGDVFMHSHSDHGTGGHWCAKVIFFSLLAILIALVGLIILENRGLSELEANAVQSQYSGVLEGWLEDAPDDDHHDEHTLELNHHDDENDADHDEEIGHSDETEADDHSEENDDEDHDEENDDDDHSEDNQIDEDDEDNEEGSEEQDLEANDEEEDLPYRKSYQDNMAEPDDDDDDDGEDADEQENEINDDIENEDENLRNEIDEDDDDDDNDKDDDDDDNDKGDDDNDNDKDDDDNDNDDETENQSNLIDDDQEDADGSDENDVEQYNVRDNEADSQEQTNEDEEEHEEEDDTSLEVERIEQEASEEEPISTELPALPEPDDDDKAPESDDDEAPEADDDDVNDPDDDFLDADDDQPPVERITAPAGKPFTEVEEDTSEKPTDTLAEEEAYEKQQEQLRREEAQASHMWLKLSIGSALLITTYAIVRRATTSSDDAQTEERPSREETPVIDRRMTLIAEEPTEAVPIRKVTQESTRPVVHDVAKTPSVVKSPPTFEDSEEEVEEEEEEEQDEPVTSKVQAAQSAKQAVKEELYSDEEEPDDDEIEEEKVVQKKVAPQAVKPPTPEPEPEEEPDDDVEIIDDEQIEEEDEDEEEISDVDDEELLTRLEAKYGRLPEPERPQRHKDGGNSIEDEWPGEPSDAYWRQQLDQAEREFNQGAWLAAADRAGAEALQPSGRARLLVARALDAAAEHKRDNALLGRAITAYIELLKMNERLSDDKLLRVTERTINRIQFRGTYLNAEPVYRLLIRRFPDDPSHRTNLTVMFLMANRADLAEDVLKETLKRWPNDRLALAQYGFVLKTQHNRLEEAIDYLQRALEGDTGPATEPRFYYHLGDSLLLLGRFDEAHEVHKRGAAHGHFLSPLQRSLYNVPRLKGQPWWNVEDTPYVKLARALEKNWKAILKEGEAAKALYEQEKEGLKERGEWSQLDLFVRGREVGGRCARAPVACAAVRGDRCRRGQVKFSAMAPGTHVRPHVGPTNCRLRMHLGLANTKDTFIRVGHEIRQWEEGKVLMFDDSFEHEVWHNGTGSRLVLIVDVWHPELTPEERRTLPAI